MYTFLPAICYGIDVD